MTVAVEDPNAHWAAWQRWRVSRVNSRSFYVTSNGQQERFLLVEWDSWLMSLARTGRLMIDGHPVQVPDGGPFGGHSPTGGSTGGSDPVALLRLGRVLKRRTELVREPDPSDSGQVVIRPEGPRPRWQIVLRLDWTEPPACSCHTSEHPPRHGLCEHAVAACLSWDDLRCQLVDLLLSR